MPTPNYQSASFMFSAADIAQLPLDVGMEVAFVGRSNAGKSTALNVLTQQKRLARVSKQPGRTQLINLFKLDDERRLIDLPGYGYAKVPASIKARLVKLVEDYLSHRTCLRGLILLMDIRHPLQKFDQHMLSWAAQNKIAVHILLTKADKLSASARQKTLQQTSHEVKKIGGEISLQIFSATERIGVDELRAKMDEWFNNEL